VEEVARGGGVSPKGGWKPGAEAEKLRDAAEVFETGEGDFGSGEPGQDARAAEAIGGAKNAKINGVAEAREVRGELHGMESSVAKGAAHLIRRLLAGVGRNIRSFVF
jgi:hypothetical protein